MKLLKEFLSEEDGIGVVEVVLILVVLIGLVIIFRDGITGILSNIIKRIKTDSDSV
ncbi:Putative Flagellin, Flp1-like, domain [Anaerocolumna jejuensis DSM 15929]|uniref:Putative Flagellin, Flp1-like, domain n=1 Tax=Anaerocolumna jejuensis DSM 15929 TaxID=1121322 RepID=A0A1M6XUT1_9FIRM|nr:Flp1 family type IVb pilin [Anaerocolumna jejuensis]SHL09714.1 Putative Flagellin, Flp1-like, domain [Anaerocolumna jejuensis DSM 15929]